VGEEIDQEKGNNPLLAIITTTGKGEGKTIMTITVEMIEVSIY
jgi:hypothetical protein